MQAIWYERQGSARDVMVLGTMPDPEPAVGEVRIRLHASGINPGDVKKRQDAFGVGMPFPRVIPHSDGAGVIDRVGTGVPASRIGERVWCFGAQSYRPFGTAAQCAVVPAAQAVALPEGVSFDQGACLGIPVITAHRAVHAFGSVAGRTVLVQGGAGTVGLCAIGWARLAGAQVIAVVRSPDDVVKARSAGAHEVLCVAGLGTETTVQALRKLAPAGVDHVVEVAFDANVEIDAEVLAVGGSIAAYATGRPTPSIPFWPLVFQNVRIFFLGSDDFPIEAKLAAASEVEALFSSGWPGFTIDKVYPLEQTAQAHEHVENRRTTGRIVIRVPD
ncbi:NADPH:quinone reductase [Variovorax fucosicus]|uniref:NADPH:quinone reductase n=1 Tax=Variovorax fucosicus TaxID=3053517 RepID=UPI0025786BCE|nr:NADPH:quinone reductase [Variovorax sp. J22G47]MDM0057761.1 NADPH:quinone reductase [Variovorax sp. J22G47]